ncbi:hypothetical protein Ancab_001752 [Ancistrocladus abbreviatus]
MGRAHMSATAVGNSMNSSFFPHEAISIEGRQLESMSLSPESLPSRAAVTNYPSSTPQPRSSIELRRDIISKVEIESFRPTSPGRSPGAGNLVSETEIESFRPTSPGAGNLVSEIETESFRPTSPGRSPGAGNLVGEIEIESFRPTSPGAGHLVQN